MANRVLIISEVTDDVLALQDALSNAHDGPFDVEHVPTLAAALERLAACGIDAVLVNLRLPDAQGIACFDRLHDAVSHTPIMTLCDLDDEALAKEAVQRGAQGWLSRGYFDNYLVPQSLRNIIERMKVEQGLYIAQARAEITLNSIGDAVISVDMHGHVDYLNVAAERMTGWPRDEARGQPIANIFTIVDSTTGRPVVNPLDYVLQGDLAADLTGECTLIDRRGRHIPIEDSAAPIHDWDQRLVGAVMVFRDISDNVALNAKMRHQAQHDFLTNLPSRVLLNDRVSLAISLARRSKAYPVLLFLDLDKFKHINDSLGHSVGDALLRAVAERLLGCVRVSDTVSRYGGDEFVILLADERQPQDAALTAQKVLHALSTPFLIDEQELYTSTSIGISVFPFDGADAVTLTKNADTAMYHAKERGRNNYQFFHEAMNERAVERQLIESNLRRALDRAEFTLHYQPKIDLLTDAITGVEALLRWEHPEWGLVPPERFIAIAEDCGLIVPIGRWVLREACRQAVRWRDDGIRAVSIAVNVSAVEFRQREFFDQALAIFEETGLDPACVQLELTETVLMRDVDRSADLLAKFKAIGVKIAVDDFGTGYSSLSYLSQFPIDVLKIDQSFVRAIDGEVGKNGAIVGAVIGMGKNLHQRVIAEGVEDEEQLAFLKAHECNEAQGYLFSRPVDAGLMQAMFNTGIAG